MYVIDYKSFSLQLIHFNCIKLQKLIMFAECNSRCIREMPRALPFFHNRIKKTLLKSPSTFLPYCANKLQTVYRLLFWLKREIWLGGGGGGNNKTGRNLMIRYHEYMQGVKGKSQLLRMYTKLNCLHRNSYLHCLQWEQLSTLSTLKNNV